MAEFTKDPPFQVEAPDSKSNLSGARVTPAAPHVPASPATAQSVWLRPFLDLLAAWIIRLGGIGVIVSIFAIFVFLVIEVIPLFQRPTFSPLGQIHVTHPIADGEAIAIGIEEQMEIAYGIVPDGVFFVSLSDGAMLPVDLPASLHRLRISAVASAGGRSTRYLIGTDDGRLIPIKITFDVSTDADGHRWTHPSPRLPQSRWPLGKAASRRRWGGWVRMAKAAFCRRWATGRMRVPARMGFGWVK